MARFFFHFFDGKTLVADDTGVNLPSVERACMEAGATALEMWPELLADRISLINCAFDIANERGEVLLRFEFMELLDVAGVGAAQPSASVEAMSSAIANTQRRAQQAKADLDASLAEVRLALDEARSLLDQI
ncbi:MAG: hypothetical protein EDM03_12240 [Porphyrobacter sp. IPPAS B-1204]|nr:MAG: hypothetical protein EDM03_12240 [Porphyrobacter sp. IPPAS B-1204]